ncbi:MAG: cytochrome c peroxidase [Saprospiraceae bacterium]
MKNKLKLGSLLLFSSFMLLSGTIDLNNLFNYEDQGTPDYINEDNTPGNNPISDEETTLGRVLFYDKNLSANNTISCASCHQQAFGFSDPEVVSVGFDGGTTGRSSMRLINARYAREDNFFWDERARNLETQTTQPIQDHVEMGFSGDNGQLDFNDLINKLEDIEYYQTLFNFVYGDSTITEQRISRALAQFVRSIESYDSKYDEGLALANNNVNANFPNFTNLENIGKNVFMSRNGGNCDDCHQAPEFDIDPNTSNNNVIGVAGMPGAIDLTNTRTPTLRDLVNPAGEPNGPMMHDGSLATLMDVVEHYNDIDFDPSVNTNLDRELWGNGRGQNLNLSQNQKDGLVAFLMTLTGSNVYTDEKWSDPFDATGSLTILSGCSPYTINEAVNICEGDEYGGYTSSGTYSDELVDGSGCEYTRVLDLLVWQTTTSSLEVTICAGDEYGGHAVAGTYTDIVENSVGCDSIITLILNVVPNPEITITTSICDGESFEGYDASGIYTHVFQSVNGCDSTRTIELTVLPVSDPACNTSSIANAGNVTPINVYPTVFSTSVTIELAGSQELTVSMNSLLGQQTYVERVRLTNGKTELSTGHLLPGVYLLTAVDYDNQQYYTQKLVKGK